MDVRLPDGTVIKGVPDGMSKAELTAKLQSNGYDISRLPAPQVNREAADTERYNPTEGMSTFEKLVASYGAAVPTAVMGIGQRLGLVSQETVDERRRLDAPLMATTAGKIGNTLGNIALAVPTVAVPGAGTVAGATAIGAGFGLLQPTATGESAVKNAAIGGSLGGGSIMAGNLIGAGYRAAKAVAEPFTRAGAKRVADRTLLRFADNPNLLAGLSDAPTATGAKLTLAEQSGDRGIAQLQDAVRSMDPTFENAIGGRLVSNNAARVNALREMSGESGARAFADANRLATGQQMYNAAFEHAADAVPMTVEQSRAMTKLLRSPAIRSAMADAKAIAANKGMNVGPSNASGSVEGLHNMKMALDDAITAAKAAGQNNKAESIKVAQSKLVGLIEDLSPDYESARKVYAEMSRPVNQMDIAAQIAKKGFSNGSDLAGNPTINRNALIGAMKDEGALMKQATGRDLGKSLSDVMDPGQMAVLNAIRSEVDRAGAVATAGQGPGSATAKRLASQNIIRQVFAPSNAMKPTLPQKAGQAIAESTLANTIVGKATNWIYSGIAEPKIQAELLKSVLTPSQASTALLAAQQQNVKLPSNLMKRLVVLSQQTGPSTAQPGGQP